MHAPRRAAFVQRRVVQPTRFVDLAVQRFALSRRRVSAVLVRPAHSGLLSLPLRVNVALDSRVGDVAHRRGEVRAGPQRRQAAAQMWKLLPQRVRREPLELVGQVRRGKRRVALHDQVHVVGHDFERMYDGSKLTCLLGK